MRPTCRDARMPTTPTLVRVGAVSDQRVQAAHPSSVSLWASQWVQPLGFLQVAFSVVLILIYRLIDRFPVAGERVTTAPDP